MNYDHAYHAGNFADVFKHIVVLAILRKLQQKKTPYCYVETHAGGPYYDLRNHEAAKTGEALDGIQKVWSLTWPEPIMQDYLSLVRQVSHYNKGAHCAVYPGSAAIAAEVMRYNDRLVLQELAINPFIQLERFFEENRRVACYHQDGYAGSKAFLPPLEKRGLVLIDPPYEEVHEWKNLKAYLTMALKRWPTGIFAIWYPIKDRWGIEKNMTKLLADISQPSLRLECCPRLDDVPYRLNGTGMCVINPPWQLAEEIQPLALKLAQVF